MCKVDDGRKDDDCRTCGDDKSNNYTSQSGNSVCGCGTPSHTDSKGK
jgi:hypothetical protein